MSSIAVDDRNTLDIVQRIALELEAGNRAEADNLMDELGRIRESSLFVEMGKLTRQLHEALGGVRYDDRLTELTEHDIPDARERLNYVVEKTEDAAHRTLNAVEAAIPVGRRLAERAEAIKCDWSRFRRRDMSPDEFRRLVPEVQDFLDEIACDTTEINDRLSDVLMAQDYQDLTGQVIRRVTEVVGQVESRLVGLLRTRGAGSGEAVAASEDPEPSPRPKAPAERDIAASGPRVGNATDAVYVNGQDDVDELLSSLGF